MKDSIVHKNSVWSAGQIERFLLQAEIPVRLGCLSASGAPLICSVWYLYHEDALWCATPKTAKLAGWLGRESRCAFEVAGDAMPYRGVRGQGRATLSAADGPRILLQLIDRYLHSRESKFAQWLIERQAEELAIRIEPEWLSAWDFSARMNG
jgi:nitroimidazol reductase NimA-like FMN-containing flavoprotein (pyridoxamine 5'-phosphate oxidase superfamily)